MIRGFTLAAVMLCGTTVAGAHESDSSVERETVEKPFLVLVTTPRYEDALALARRASARLKLPLDLRELSPVEHGLTWSRRECDDNGWDYPCYVARGRYDDGAYVSIEHGSWFSGGAVDEYVVIAASGEEGVRATLATARQHFPRTFVHEWTVYLGCMH